MLSILLLQPVFVKVRLTSTVDGEAKLGQLKYYVLIFKLHDKWTLRYKAFCAGSIIAKNKVLTSANCFLTNRKRIKLDVHYVRAVAGIVHTYAKEPLEPNPTQQWRQIHHIYSQKFFRYPAYDLAILEVTEQYIFNQFVNKINYATINQDFDGVCMATGLRPVKSWSTNMYVYIEEVKMIKRSLCEMKMLRCCHLYYCTSNDPFGRADPEIQGGGLICFGTGDPAETDESQGLLVGVTALINAGLPNIHTRVGMFHKWVTDDSTALTAHNIILTCLLTCVYIF